MTEFNASDRKAIRAAEKASAIADRERGEVVTNLMSTAPGRRFIWDKLGDAGIFRTTFSTDPGQMAFNEGQRNQGLALLNDVIQYCPEQFIQAMREANGRRDIDNAQRNAGQRPRGEDAGGDDSGSADLPAGDDAGSEAS